jgi:RNA polymerase sigma factor (sigma-70 family)
VTCQPQFGGESRITRPDRYIFRGAQKTASFSARRMAIKRGSGKRPVELVDELAGDASGPRPDARYEEAVFYAKVEAALRLVERDSELLEFSVWRMRVLDGRSGKQVAEALGISEPTVSRRLASVRARLRERLAEVIARYSFTEDEAAEATRNGLELNPNKATDALFDEAVCEIYHRQQALRELA